VCESTDTRRSASGSALMVQMGDYWRDSKVTKKEQLRDELGQVTE
jgi:hypothetical protein